MRFQLWAYKPDGYAQLAVVDTKFEDEFRVGRSGYVMVRDQSVYPEDNGRFVWKNAAYPMAVKGAIKRGKGVLIAEANHLAALDANMPYNLINYLWEDLNNEPQEER